MDSDSVNRWDNLIELQPHQMVQIGLLGAIIGIVVWLLTLILQHAVFGPIMCSGGTCSGAVGISGAIATIVAALIGLLGLVRLSVFRPLLIVLAVVICLWGLSTWVGNLSWYEALSWSVLLYGFTYSTFSWLVRPRAFVPVVVIVAVLVLLARLAASL